ncbi:MAG: alpha/beta fold hydrolase [Dermatophilaceae bacterium]
MSIIPDQVPSALTSPGFFTLLEPSRMVVENSALTLATPLLVRQQAPQGRPILVVTGALSTNVGTNQMRRVLTRIGHHPHTPPTWTMYRKPMRIFETVLAETEKLYEQYDEPVTLAGWCMGGVFTRMTAQAVPAKVRQVINMGSARTAVWYPKELSPAADPLPVPSTVIYSRTDGMTYWRHVCDDAGPQVENIEVLSSHWGMANHPHTLHIVADRLAQPSGQWQPYQGLRGATASTTPEVGSAAA